MTRPGILAALVLSLGLAGCGVFDSPDRQIRRAEDALKSGDYNASAVILRTLVDKNPADGRAWLLLARTLYQLGDTAGTERTLQLAIENEAPPAEVAVLRMEQRLGAGDFQTVLDAAEDEASPLDSFQRRYYRARGLQGLRRVPEALVLYRELATEADSSELQVRIAQCHAFHGREKLMIEALDKAPDRAEGWLLRLNLAQRERDSSAAREGLRKAIETAPGQLTAVQQTQMLLAGVDQALRAGDVAQAGEFRATLVRLLPQAPVTQLVSAQIRLHSDSTPEVTSELQRLVQAAPELHPARALLIAALLRAGSLELALKEAGTAATGLPDNAEPRQVQEAIRAAAGQPEGSVEREIAIASALTGLQQPALARTRLQEAIKNHPDSLPMKTAQVRVELAAGRPEDALALAQQLATDHPDDSNVRLLLVSAQEAAGQYAAAAETFEGLWKASPNGPTTMMLVQIRRRAGLPVIDMPMRQWLTRAPNDIRIRLELGTALQQEGDFVAAAREFERVVAMAPAGSPARPIALNNLAVAYAQLGNPRALETARSAYELAKEVPSVMDTYGWLLAKAGRTAEALPLLRSAAEANPTNLEVRYHYAAALARGGQSDQARLLLADVLLDYTQFDGRTDAERMLATL